MTAFFVPGIAADAAAAEDAYGRMRQVLGSSAYSVLEFDR